jgi:hypothetical protein
VSSAVRALEVVREKRLFSPARLDGAGVVPDAGAVDREVSSRRRRKKGKQRAASVSVVFFILMKDSLTIYSGYVGRGVHELHKTG